MSHAHDGETGDGRREAPDEDDALRRGPVPPDPEPEEAEEELPHRRMAPGDDFVRTAEELEPEEEEAGDDEEPEEMPPDDDFI